MAASKETKKDDSKPAKSEAKAASKATKGGKGEGPSKGKGKGESKDAEQAANERWAILYARFQKWVWTNARTLILTGVSIVVVAAAVVGWIVYHNWAAETASNIVFTGTSADLARVASAAPADIRQRYGMVQSEADHVNTEKSVMESVRARYAGTSYALVARLSQANLALDSNKLDDAAAIYGEIIADPSSKAFPFLRVRALEGMGIVRENQKRFDDALSAYQSLASENFHGAKQLGIYRQANVYLEKNDSVTAIAKLKEAKELFDKAPKGSGDTQLEMVVERQLRSLEPMPSMPTAPTGLGTDMDPQQLQEMINQMQQQQQQPAPSAPQ